MQGKRPQGLLCTHIHKHTRDGVHTKHTHTNVCRYPGDVFAHSEVLKVSQQRGNYKVRGGGGVGGTTQDNIILCAVESLSTCQIHLMGGAMSLGLGYVKTQICTICCHQSLPEYTRCFMNCLIPNFHVTWQHVSFQTGILHCENLKSHSLTSVLQ